MSALQLLLIRHPERTLALASPDYVLLFRAPPPSHHHDSVSVVVELLPRDQADLSQAVVLNGRVQGCLGVLAVGNDTFLCIVTQSTSLGSSYSRTLSGLGCEPIQRILAVDFFCLTSPSYDYLHAPTSSFPLENSDYLDDSSAASYNSPYASSSSASSSSYANNGIGVSAGSLRGADPTPLEHPCQGIRKILSNASFYFSSGPEAFDLSTRLQARVDKQGRARQRREGELADDEAEGEAGEGGEGGGYQSAALDHDARFLFNQYMVAPLLSFRSTLSPEMRDAFDQQAFMVLAIQGFCGRMEVNLGGQPAVLSLISRLSWKRSGTRFNVRGVADDGSVANFAETETLLRTPSLLFSFVQTRGSVPLFWEEGGGQPFAPKITITRPIEASLPAFLRHFEDMLENYDKVHIINLLGSKEGEAALTSAYSTHLSAASSLSEPLAHSVGMTDFDFHARAKYGGIESVKSQLAREVGEVEERFGACVVGVPGEEGGGEKRADEEEVTPVMKQTGVFRTNCKDCLDRTNAVEDSLSRFALEEFLRNTQDRWAGSDTALWASHRVLWADNGDALSKIYVGTGAINTSFTRTGKKSLAGMLSDASKSVSRVYQQQFVDSGKQRAIDALLGNLATSRKVRVFNPIHDALRLQLRERSSEYTSYEQTTVWVGTYNLNGKPPGSESLLPWLCWFPIAGPDPAFLVVAFQEIVPLSPQQIMATDPEKKRRWESHLLSTISSRPSSAKDGSKADYILLRSEQLVGTALMVLCRKDVAGEVRNVEAATKKTGLKGMAGNKGAVAIRLDYRNSSFCFLTAHLAAGHSNYAERDQDFRTIDQGLHFSRGKTIANHDNVVWAADTNYRISLPNEEVRGLAEADAYAELYDADQLNHGMRNRGIFPGYEEAAILFRPTYKYDNGTDIYDTSEKQRIPAYTDRILYKGTDLDAFRYQRAELTASDHRPVYALFRARVRVVDEPKRAELRKRLLKEIMANEPQEKMDGGLVRQFANGSGAKELPPPSDDKQAWWNEPDGSFKPPPLPPRPSTSSRNAFDSSSAAAMPSQRRPPPAVPSKPAPPPAPSPSILVGDLLNLDDDSVPASPPAATAAPSSFHAVRRKPPPQPPTKRSTSPTSIRSSDSGAKQAPPPIPRRPHEVANLLDGPEAAVKDAMERTMTGESWTVIDR
ncbi:hypothetical protein JCM8097_008735 [Rhodosporidiobolus ruineniae]